MTDVFIAPPENVLWRGAIGDFEPLAKKWNETFRMYVPFTPEYRILEIGCGSGRMAIPFKNYFTTGRYVGVDISEKAIKWAQDALGDNCLRFQHIDIANEWYRPGAGACVEESRLPFEDKSFDFIFLASVFTHLRASEAVAYLKDISRLLTPNGAVISTWFLLDDFSRANIHRGISRFTFEHKTAPSTWDHFPHQIGKATAIDGTVAREAHQKNGFSVQLVRGGWSYTPFKSQITSKTSSLLQRCLGGSGAPPLVEYAPARHSQDILIGRL